MSHSQFKGDPTGLLIELDTNTSNLWGGEWKQRMVPEKFFDRVAIDPKHPESRRKAFLKTSWETKLGRTTLSFTASSICTAREKFHKMAGQNPFSLRKFARERS